MFGLLPLSHCIIYLWWFSYTVACVLGYRVLPIWINFIISAAEVFKFHWFQNSFYDIHLAPYFYIIGKWLLATYQCTPWARMKGFGQLCYFKSKRHPPLPAGNYTGVSYRSPITDRSMTFSLCAYFSWRLYKILQWPDRIFIHCDSVSIIFLKHSSHWWLGHLVGNSQKVVENKAQRSAEKTSQKSKKTVYVSTHN